jgi:hypothetical protein
MSLRFGVVGWVRGAPAQLRADGEGRRRAARLEERSGALLHTAETGNVSHPARRARWVKRDCAAELEETEVSRWRVRVQTRAEERPFSRLRAADLWWEFVARA